MLADNNLECFGILDLVEMMQGMSAEPSDCSTTACGVACPEGYATVKRTSCGEGDVVSRCCLASAYPDVLVLADRGVSSCAFAAPSGSSLDLSPLQATWTTAREILVQPGGTLLMERDYGEIDMASPDVLAAFLQRSLARFPASTDTFTRKFALVFWDHGNGWRGYGVDDTCSATSGVSAAGCDQFTLPTLIRGLSAGLGSRQLDVIGFDACLMSMYEVAAAIAPYSRTLLASELLEPGHGWDYGALGAMVTAGLGAKGAGVGTSDEIALAKIWIDKYKAQAVAFQTTGVTLALTDLAIASSRLVSALGSLADALSTSLRANASAAASAVLRRRQAMAKMGTGDQESSVDFGSMLAELAAASDLASAPRTAVAAVAAAYNASVLAFGRDDDLPRGTGVAIFFPLARSLDSDYAKLATGQLTSSINKWAAFLTNLYDASVTFVASDTPFAFVPSAASVPYTDAVSGSYVLSATLSSPLALSATVYYGFADVTDKAFVLAGAQPAVIEGSRVVGVWRRLLWGVSQALNTTAGQLYRSALMFATEEWQTSADGATALSVSLTANVRYGPTCSSTRSQLGSALLKYTYVFSSNRATLQLFAQQPSGAFGEVSAQAGGVIIPLMYKLPRDFSTSQVGTYEYSNCLKWGYNGTVRVIAVNVAAAADSLGVDLDEDLLLFLQAKDVSLTKSAYWVGAFDTAATAATTVGGCQCMGSWRQGSGGALYTGCANPDDAPGGPWCPILPGSCTQPAKATGNLAAAIAWDYCTRQRTLSGCTCADAYLDSSNATTVYAKCFRGAGDPRFATRGAWCAVNASTCPTPNRAHGSLDTSYDYCETRTLEGCSCMGRWVYNGVVYNGTCATGFYPDAVPEGLSNSTRWCHVNPGCPTRNQIVGHKLGLCGPAVPPTAGPANASCALPVTLPGGVTVHNCQPWSRAPDGSERADGISPACPTQPGGTGWATCNARTCAVQDMSACPATLPSATPSLASSAWLNRTCLAQLCAAALRRKDSNTCAADAAAATSAFTQLNASADAAAVLKSSYSAASLEAHCAATVGTDCLSASILPACPALALNGTAMYDSAYLADTSVSSLCRLDCLKALCAVTSGAVRCARSRLVESLRLGLTEAMDAKCGAVTAVAAATGFNKPVMLLCAELLAPKQSCAATTTLTAAAGNIALSPTVGSSPPQYAPLSNCTWRIQPVGLPYIKLAFSYFATEPVYDTLLIEDADGVVAVLAGNGSSGSTALPDTIYTDTGLLKLTFTSDSSIQQPGFVAAYSATATRAVSLPSCSDRQKLVMVVVKTASYASEMSWVLVGYRVVQLRSANTSSTATSSSPSSTSSTSSTATASANATTGAATQQTMLAAGGALPAAIYSYFSSSDPSLQVLDTQYKDSRTYTSYVCLPAGISMLYLYDAYGDGWNNASITLAYVRNANSAYVMLNGTVRAYNSTVPVNVFSNMPPTPNEYLASLTRNKGNGTFSVRAVVRLEGERSGGLAQTKQLILRGSVSSQLAVDITAVGITSLSSAGGSSRRRLGADLTVQEKHGTGVSEEIVPYEYDEESYDLEYDGEDEEVEDGAPGVKNDPGDHPDPSAATPEATASSDPVPDLGASAAGSQENQEARAEPERDPELEPADWAEAVPLLGPAGEPLVHEEGVVAALIASARALGLKPVGLSARGDVGAGGSGEGGARSRQRQRRRAAEAAGGVAGDREEERKPVVRRRASSIAELLASPDIGAMTVGDLVSTQQPEWMRHDADLDGDSSSSGSTRAGKAASGSSAAAAGVHGEGEARAGTSTLPNGVVLGPDGVPFVAFREPGPGESGASAQRTLLATPRRTAGGAGHHSVFSADTVAAAAVVVHPPGLAAADELAGGIKRKAARAVPLAGRNGGRTPVPGLRERLPSLLEDSAHHIAALSAAVAAADGDAQQEADGTTCSSAADEPCKGAGATAAAEADGAPALADGAVAAAPSLASTLTPDPAVNPALAAVPHGAVDAAPGPEEAPKPHAQRRKAVSRRQPGPASAAAAGPALMAAALEAAATPEERAAADAAREAAADVEAEAERTAQKLRRRRGASHPRRRRTERRRLQQSSSGGLDVTVLVVGYNSRDEANVAAGQLQAALRSGELQATLSDAGWTDAAPSMTSSPQILEGASVVDDGSGGGGLALALIIGIAAGIGLLAVLCVGLIAFIVIRRRSARVEEEEAAARAKVAEDAKFGAYGPGAPVYAFIETSSKSTTSGTGRTKSMVVVPHARGSVAVTSHPSVSRAKSATNLATPSRTSVFAPGSYGEHINSNTDRPSARQQRSASVAGGHPSGGHPASARASAISVNMRNSMFAAPEAAAASASRSSPGEAPAAGGKRQLFVHPSSKSVLLPAGSDPSQLVPTRRTASVGAWAHGGPGPASASGSNVRNTPILQMEESNASSGRHASAPRAQGGSGGGGGGGGGAGGGGMAGLNLMSFGRLQDADTAYVAPGAGPSRFGAHHAGAPPSRKSSALPGAGGAAPSRQSTAQPSGGSPSRQSTAQPGSSHGGHGHGHGASPLGQPPRH